MGGLFPLWPRRGSGRAGAGPVGAIHDRGSGDRPVGGRASVDHDPTHAGRDWRAELCAQGDGVQGVQDQPRRGSETDGIHARAGRAEQGDPEGRVAIAGRRRGDV